MAGQCPNRVATHQVVTAGQVDLGICGGMTEVYVETHGSCWLGTTLDHDCILPT